MKANEFKLVGHKAQFLFRDKDVVEVEALHTKGRFSVEGTINGEPFSMPLKGMMDVFELVKAAIDLPVMSSKGEEQDIPATNLPPPKPKSEPVPPPKSTFIPPTEEATATRTRIGSKDVRGSSLWAKFEEITPRPYKGKKILTEDMKRDQTEWERMRAVARSYILAGDYNMIQKWIEHLEQNPTYYMEAWG